jgi:pantoate--beta-alanine ligase
MQTLHTISELRAFVRRHRMKGKTIGFVPTMGNLHEGHLSLITEAKNRADIVICSIFVNPMQFGANEDLDSYPRTLDADSQALESKGCHLLFAPNANEVYPFGLGEQTRVDVPELGNYHCGASRPGHFVGVATVVAKLFNMVQADIAVFGEKDFQQLAIIRKMASDLCFPIEIIGIPTSREKSGLARSSRNGYLSTAEKTNAAILYQTLLTTREALKEGERDFDMLTKKAKALLEDSGFKPDYFNIANPETLAASQISDVNFVILVAAYLGKTRLIDNITLSIEN